MALAVAALILMMTPAAVHADSTLLGLWRFEDDLTDASGNGFHGTYGQVTGVGSFSPGGTPSFSADTPGLIAGSTRSLDLSINAPNDAASQPFAVNVGTSAELNPTDSLSLAAWFKTGITPTGQAFIARGDGTGTDRAYSAHINSHTSHSTPGALATNWTRFDGATNVNTNVNTDLDIPGDPMPDFHDDQWHHVVVTLDSTSNGGDGLLRMIVDGGTFVATDDEAIDSIHSVNLPTLIGAFGNGALPNQTLLDDVALFRGALTTEEIESIRGGDFSAFLPPEVPEPGSILLWSACAAVACFYRWHRKERGA